ncbi:pyrroline-5-carboxylate reductase 1, mitochondrial [Patella vulgata]|uniref:pyrroline-5-carboxylate reductase 1, mitochondrial n=1 Tax=Patella vulgata TaxID=6465 RepID=UPI00217FAEF6|nr:pyrroline-5-carboxylate reductase 1, mitochondrial [Patella vulgata]
MSTQMATDLSKSAITENTMVGFIGAGRMAQAMAKGFISSGLVRAGNITASDHNQQCLQILQDLGAKTTRENQEVVTKSDLVVLAVKPHIVKPVLREVAPIVKSDTLFVSIAAGVTIESIESNLPVGTRVVRVMPNTPALVSAGASVLTKGTTASDTDSKLVKALLSSIGICEEGSESYLDAVTGLSGSGPAYAFVAIEAMADGGVKQGLPRDLALKLAAQTLLGAAKMVLETGKHPGQLKDEVCSPGGTTIAAIASLEKSGFRGALIDAVEVATLRAHALGATK